MALAAVEEPEETEEGLEPIEVPTIEVRPTEGVLRGRTLVMQYPSTTWYIAQQRGDLAGAEMLEAVLGAIVEHDLGRDPASLPPSYVVAIGNAWHDAIRDQAFPPVPGSD